MSSFHQSSQNFSLVTTKGDILVIDVPVSSLYLFQQSALWMLAISKQSPHAYIVGKQGQQQGILTIALEVFKTFPKVGTEQRVCLPFRHIGREMLTRLQLMLIRKFG